MSVMVAGCYCTFGSLMGSKITILFACCFSVLLVQAQDRPFMLVDNDGLEVTERRQKQWSDSLDTYLLQLQQYAFQLGYLTAHVTVDTSKGDTIKLYLEKGPLIQWARLYTDSIDRFFLEGAGIVADKTTGKVFQQSELLNLVESILVFAENNGYPFASAGLCNVIWKDSLIEAQLCCRSNRRIVFDTLQVLGNALLSRHYLQQYTGIKPGQPYNEALLSDLDQLLDELPHVRRTQPSVVRFSGNLAKVVVFLDERNANQFDAVLGFLPNNNITGRLVITGQGHLQLFNSFGQGEQIQARFSKLESSTKSLNLQGLYPYLPAVPLGLDAGLLFFLRDSTFLEREVKTGLYYRFSARSYLKAQVAWYGSDVLSIDTANVLLSKNLPAEADIRTRSYGLEYAARNLNDAVNPGKGWSLFVGGLAGTRQLIKNATVISLSDPASPEFDFESLYDSVDLQTLALSYRYDFSVYLPLSEFTTLLCRVQGAENLNKQIFANELYRIGGILQLRGFDDQSILASSYHIFTFEPRYLWAKNAYAGFFADIAYTANRSLDQLTTSWPYGFGAMFTFESKAGIFGLTYALGGSKEAPVLFRNGKLHFGYVNYF